MLNAEEVRAMIICRIAAMSSRHQDEAWKTYCLGQAAALAAVLCNGRVPSLAGSRIRNILDAANIPYRMQGDTMSWDLDWLKAHGFLIQPGDDPSKILIVHSRFDSAWKREHALL